MSAPSRRRSLALRGLWCAFTVTVVALGTLWAPAAQAEVPGLAVRAVDARDGRLVVDVASATSPSEGDVRLVVDGREVPPTSLTPLDEAGETASVMVLIDNSASVGNGAVQIAKSRLDELAPGEGGIGELGVTTIGGTAAVVIAPTTSLRSVENALAGIGPTGGAALHDGIIAASEALERTGGQRNLVIVTGNDDAGSGAGFPEVQRAVRDSDAVVHVVALEGGSTDMGAMEELVRIGGGSIQSGSSDDLEAMYGVVATQIDQQFRIVANAPDLSDAEDLVRLEVAIGGQRAEVAFRPGLDNVGAEALQPLASPGVIDRLFASALVKWSIVLLATLSAGMVVYAVGMLVLRRNEGLEFALRHYDAYTVEEEPEYEDDGSTLARGAFLKRAVALTGQMAQRQGVLGRAEELLERADVPLRPAEALFFYSASAILVTLATAALTRNVLVVVAVLLAALLVPKFVLEFRAKRRNKRFVAQLPDMLQLLAGTLRAGYSIGQGFEAVSQEIDDPMGKELRRVIAEARLGRPLEQALDAAAERMRSDDFSWAVMAIRIQREVGGNLAELLMTVADTMTQRERLRRDVASLTAEGRISAIVLGILPPGLGLVMWVINGEYIGRLTQDGLGIGMLVAAVVMMLIGFAWMRKIINIEI